MKALLKMAKGKGNVEIMEVEEPEVSAGQVKIKVSVGGICGTDIKIREDMAPYFPPVILCHEFSGIIEDVGEGVKGFQRGDRVISETAQVICGKCYFCKSGNFMMCPNRRSIGYGVDGAFAEYIVVREGIVHKIPEGVSMEEAALCEPLAVAVHAVFDTISLAPTDTVVVLGAGAIGQLIAQVVKNFGATVIMTGINIDEGRLKLALELGTDIVINTQRESLGERVDAITDGLGADYIIDASGSQIAIAAGLRALKSNGTFVQVGLTAPELTIPYALFPQKQLTLKGTFGHNWMAWEKALKLLGQGKVNVKPLISAVLSLDEWEKGFELAHSGEAIKVLLKP